MFRTSSGQRKRCCTPQAADLYNKVPTRGDRLPNRAPGAEPETDITRRDGQGGLEFSPTPDHKLGAVGVLRFPILRGKLELRAWPKVTALEGRGRRGLGHGSERPGLDKMLQYEPPPSEPVDPASDTISRGFRTMENLSGSCRPALSPVPPVT
ncbi:hypothetical protein VTH82DRAFT_4427 [Thermothelomyces myriococcoides]